MRKVKIASSWAVLSLFLGSGVLAVDAPPKFKVKSVFFEGNQAFGDGILKQVMLTRPAGFLRPSYYYAEIFRDDLKNLVELYRRNGYLEADIAGTQVVIDSTGRTVHIHVQISEGELTCVEGVTVFGNSIFTDDLLFQKTKIRIGDPLNRKKIQDATLAILTLYSNAGYLEAEVTPDIRVNQETHRALIDFVIHEKAQFTISEIRLEGLQKTLAKVVLRELLFHPGEVVRYSSLLKSQRRLYLTGLFESVFIRPQPAADGNSTQKCILIELQEKMSREFNIGIGYGSVEKARVTLGVSNTNLAGTARKIGLTTRISFVNRCLEASFTEPWTLGSPWRTDANLLTEYLEEPGFDLRRTGGRVEIGRSFWERSNASITYRYEDAKLSHVRVRPIPEKYKSNVRSLTLSLNYDSRDNLFNASQGLYLEWTSEFAGSFLHGTDTFVRSIGRFKYLYPWKSSTILAGSLELGWMDFFGTSHDIPLNERFYTGGPNSLRGFGYRLVGPLDQHNVPTGGKSKLVCNLEIRHSLYKMIGLVFFVDLGNVWSDPKHYHFSDLRTSPGFGFRVNTPIGILRCDYGINLQPRKGESPGRWVFNMGQAF